MTTGTFAAQVFDRQLAEQCLAAQQSLKPEEWLRVQEAAMKLKITHASLPFLFLCAREGEAYAQTFSELRRAGQNYRHLYALLHAIYLPAFGSGRTDSNVEVELAGVSSNADDWAACRILPSAGRIAPMERILGAAGMRAARPDPAYEADAGAGQQRLAYDIRGRRMPAALREAFGGDPRGGRVFCLRSLQSDESGLFFDVDHSSYGSVVDTCDCLTDEAFVFAGIAANHPGSMTAQEALARMPWRAALHRKANGDPRRVLLEPGTRAAGIGVACVTAFLNGSRVSAVRAMRSAATGVLPEIWHVVPAGMCSCFDPGDARVDESTLPLILHKEFLEEIFCDEAAERMQVGSQVARYVSAEIGHRLYPGDPHRDLTRTVLTGLAIDFTNLRTEICLLAYIRNPEVVRSLRQMRPNWEHTELNPETSLSGAIGRGFHPPQWVQSGGVAWQLAIDYLLRNFALA